jgi:hypothetical protein
MVEETTTTNNEENGNGNGNGDKKCPPGMKPDGKGGCVAASNGNGEGKPKTEEANAGDTTEKGAGQITDASTVTEPAQNKKCPPGTTLGEDGECHPSGNPAGQTGGAGTGDADSPGKEAVIAAAVAETMKPIMAQYAEYFGSLNEAFKTSNQQMLQALTGQLGIPGAKKESAAFGVKMESASSLVDDSGHKSVHMEAVEEPAKFFEEAKAIKRGNQATGFHSWLISPEAYLASLKKGLMNYGSGHAHGKLATRS